MPSWGRKKTQAAHTETTSAPQAAERDELEQLLEQEAELDNLITAARADAARLLAAAREDVSRTEAREDAAFDSTLEQLESEAERYTAAAEEELEERYAARIASYRHLQSSPPEAIIQAVLEALLVRETRP